MAGNANSGRKALPATVHVLTGNRSKKGAADLKDDIRPEIAIPEPPMHLAGEALTEWHRITPLLEKLGLVAALYRNSLALYCDAWADYVAARYSRDCAGTYATSMRTGYKQQSAETIEMRAAAAAMHRYAMDFGLTPSAIRSVTANPQLGLFDVQPKDPAQKYFG